jgi:signal transduction histidine kinase
MMAALIAGYGGLLLGFLGLRHKAAEQTNGAPTAKPQHAADPIAAVVNEFAANSSDWLFETDQELRIVHASEQLSHFAGGRNPAGEPFDKASGAVETSRSRRRLMMQMAERLPIDRIEVPARHGGVLRYWQITGRPVFDKAGRFTGYRGIGRDVTAHHRTARHLLRTREEAEQASSAKSLFLAMMSHELRTPLNAIIGFSEIMAEEREGPLGNPAYRRYARDILDSSCHLAALIGDVIEFARVERAGLKLFEQPVDAAELLEVCVKMCRQEARYKNFVIGEVVEVSGVEVVGDLTRLKQILVNLLSNAVKFTPPEGHVEARLSRSGEGDLEFRIADSGIGIERRHLKRIFEPFVQGDAGIARRFGGIGLGLPIARKLARLHGGDVTIESKPGVGTTVRFTVPASRVKPIARSE